MALKIRSKNVNEVFLGQTFFTIINNYVVTVTGLTPTNPFGVDYIYLYFYIHTRTHIQTGTSPKIRISWSKRFISVILYKLKT